MLNYTTGETAAQRPAGHWSVSNCITCFVYSSTVIIFFSLSVLLTVIISTNKSSLFSDPLPHLTAGGKSKQLHGAELTAGLNHCGCPIGSLKAEVTTDLTRDC